MPAEKIQQNAVSCIPNPQNPHHLYLITKISRSSANFRIQIHLSLFYYNDNTSQFLQAIEKWQRLTNKILFYFSSAKTK